MPPGRRGGFYIRSSRGVEDAAEAVYHAAVLEEVAKMAVLTLTIDPGAQPAPQHVLDKHFMRKHGPNAYYGQKQKR